MTHSFPTRRSSDLPSRRESFRETVIATAHTTDIGLCINDWSLVPCPNHGSCADCGDHLVEKGNNQQKARAEVLLGENERSEEHTTELQSLMRISYAVFCLNKKK